MVPCEAKVALQRISASRSEIANRCTRINQLSCHCSLGFVGPVPHWGWLDDCCRGDAPSGRSLVSLLLDTMQARQGVGRGQLGKLWYSCRQGCAQVWLVSYQGSQWHIACRTDDFCAWISYRLVGGQYRLIGVVFKSKFGWFLQKEPPPSIPPKQSQSQI